MDALGENADPSQTPHVGTNVDRIDPLPGRVHFEHLGQDPGGHIEKLPVKALFRNHVTERREGLGAHVLGLIRFTVMSRA
mgnify:CR=1 FL=1